MRRERSLKNLYELTAQLRAWAKAGHSPRVISELQDQLFMKQFGYTREELVYPLTPTQLTEIKEWCFEDVIEIAEDYDFDITCPNSSEGVMLERVNDHLFDEWEIDDRVVRALRYDYDPSLHGPIEETGCVIPDWFDWVCMMMASEEGLFPSTPEQIKFVELARSAKKFAEAATRDRHKTKNDGPDAASVFGATKRFKEGVIVSPASRFKNKRPARKIQVEVRHRRGR
ncbi:hypothetical protein Mchl_5323 [Methylorubrum extorquens CM4]|uniref:Uncharacterized protein n=2 Tax=Methylorubrum extorquens TaxID=408 RepID=B7KWK7_METC4|nr:hypothetical protein Mchl_5323 [Methylorubrum extorquens CM4]